MTAVNIPPGGSITIQVKDADTDEWMTVGSTDPIVSSRIELSEVIPITSVDWDPPQDDKVGNRRARRRAAAMKRRAK